MVGFVIEHVTKKYRQKRSIVNYGYTNINRRSKFWIRLFNRAEKVTGLRFAVFLISLIISAGKNIIQIFQI